MGSGCCHRYRHAAADIALPLLSVLSLLQVLTPLKVPHPSPREQSVPELVSTPSDIGIWEVSHEMRGKFSWRRLFQDPSTFEAASPKK